MGNTIEEHAKTAALAPGDKTVLDFILGNRRETCLMTSGEIAARLGVSPSRVVRLSGKLKYDNFASFRRALQEEVVSARPAADAKLPLDRIKQYEKLSDAEILAAYSANLDQNIKRDQTESNDGKIIAAAEMVSQARRVCVAGFRACSGFAASIGVMLTCVRPDVFVVGENGPLVDSLIDLGKNDVMLAVSFERYSSSAAFAVQMAHDAGCRVIALTDSYAAPVAKGAEEVIVCSSGNMSFFDSYVSFLINMEKILLLVSKRNKEANEARLLRMESYLQKNGQY